MSTQVRPTVLERILESTREELERRKRELPLEELEYQAFAIGGAGGGEPAALRGALREPGIAVIAEFKRRSPSAGTLREAPDLHELVRAYERGGASALSVLTEGPNFDGTLEDLRAARAACELPILRKDFIVDEYQLYEAKVARARRGAADRGGAASRRSWRRCTSARERSGWTCWWRCTTATSCARRWRGGRADRDQQPRPAGLQRGRGAHRRLMGEIPAGVTVVSESGIAGAEQLRRLEEAGVDAVLVGEALMRSADPEAALRTLRGDRADTSAPEIARAAAGAFQ